MAIIEPQQFAPEPDREREHLDAAPAGDHEVPKLVEEHNDREHEQERNDVAEHAPANRAEVGQKTETHVAAVPRPASLGAPPPKPLGCLCGNFGQEFMCQQS